MEKVTKRSVRILPEMFFAALLGLALPPPMTPGNAQARRESLTDDRPAKLETFFRSYQCPQPYYIDHYLSAADSYALDYRFLPAVSVRESTCGQHNRLNNRWGWDHGRSRFRSVKNGIYFVSSQLAEGESYKGKTLDEKLFTYNPDLQYVEEVKMLMRQIDN
jgi:hypothetical protein